MVKKLKSILEQQQLFLTLLPVFFVVNGYNDLFGYIAAKITVIAFLACVLLTVFLYIVFKIVFTSKRKASLVAFFSASFILTFGPLHDFLKETIGNNVISSYSFILPFFLVFFCLLVLGFKYSTSSFKRAYVFLNVLMLLFVSIELTKFTFKSLLQPTLVDDRFTAFHQFTQNKTDTISDKPDIFFFVFDAMPSSKSMMKEWNFDNSKLDSFLTDEGFYVASISKSNYNITMLSVTSCLNMEYLLPKQIFTGGEIQMIEKSSPALLKNSTTEILRTEGYQIYQYQPLSTKNKDWKGGLFFEFFMIDHYWLKTFPGRIYADLVWHLGSNKTLRWIRESALKKEHYMHKENLTYTLQKIKKSCSLSDNPKFVYGHFMLPHGPYIVDSSGRMLIEAKELNKDTSEVALFKDQVKFVNHLIKDLVFHIKTKNKKNTIIVIEGDHGFRNIYGREYMIFDNLNAIYFPDGNYSQLNQSHSPVNTFRYIFNKYFAANFIPLKDSSSYVPYTLLRKDIP